MGGGLEVVEADLVEEAAAAVVVEEAAVEADLAEEAAAAAADMGVEETEPQIWRRKF